MSKKTCIVVPCYNEEKRLQLNEFRAALSLRQEVDFCFVNDGSSDGTQTLLHSFATECSERVLVVSRQANKGKAESVREGVTVCLEAQKYDFIGFMDADLATPLSEIYRLIEIIEKKETTQGVIGSRIKRLGASIDRKICRHYMGRFFATIVAVLFHLNAYDTQCGAKIFRKELALSIFNTPFLSPWLFDVELLLRVRKGRADYEDIIEEIPLNCWIEQGDSRIKPSYLFRMPFELLRIYRKYK